MQHDLDDAAWPAAAYAIQNRQQPWRGELPASLEEADGDEGDEVTEVRSHRTPSREPADPLERDQCQAPQAAGHRQRIGERGAHEADAATPRLGNHPLEDAGQEVKVLVAVEV